jgi:hypothetical protein
MARLDATANGERSRFRQDYLFILGTFVLASSFAAAIIRLTFFATTFCTLGRFVFSVSQ